MGRNTSYGGIQVRLSRKNKKKLELIRDTNKKNSINDVITELISDKKEKKRKKISFLNDLGV